MEGLIVLVVLGVLIFSASALWVICAGVWCAVQPSIEDKNRLSEIEDEILTSLELK